MSVHIQLVKEPIDLAAAYRMLEDDGSGAAVVFCGRVRDRNDGKAVVAVEYSAYADMATAECLRLWTEAAEKRPLTRGVIIHRVGRLTVGTPSIVIGVAAAHRAEAFAGARYLIEEFKHRVPIWKREEYTEGEMQWVVNHP
ncbi:MAG: molybdenum cofactor biosynthesis protein MoaE [Deltaproteobacteria bacterium]|nr:molybdenum cofactor biosynthesis protein MoaE [Deltaproteobacteria bacterium]